MAVAVHPADERYNTMAEKVVRLPLTGRTIPVVFDTHVEREFGSGALKVTPAHDLNDFEIARRHNLDAMKVMDDNGIMNEAAGIYAGLDRFACRQRIVEDLEKAGLLEKIEEHQHGVGHCYRCATVVEPTLSKQWFVAVKPLAERAIEAVQSGDIAILPKTWDNTFYDWMHNIRDWCISRQIWWGHQIPAWTCEACGELVVAESDPVSCPKCGGALQRESDVLDTWFSSALWPFSTLGWPEQTRELKFFYPTSTLITSFDILFFWVARMMMMGLHFMGEVPFHHVYLHALVRDKFGKKMSKSKGNVLDPLELMDRYGTDALRFTLIAFAAQGRDIRLAEERIEGYRHFINKIWNAARFALMHINECDPAVTRNVEAAGFALPHRWILHRLNQCTAEVGRSLDDYRFNDAASAIYHFVWHEFCDWYLEWIKADLYGEDVAAQEESRAVLFTVLEVILKLLHPITPFVTEEIWHVLPGERSSIMVEPFPEARPEWDNEEAAAQAEVFMAVVGGIRNIRSEMMVHPSAAIEALVICHNPGKLAGLAPLLDSLKGLTRASGVTLADQGSRPMGAAANILSDIEIYVPLAGLVDVEKELAKLQKEQARVETELARAHAKLGNEKFMANAPEEVVAKERDKISEQQDKREKIRAGMARLAELAG